MQKYIKFLGFHSHVANLHALSKTLVEREYSDAFTNNPCLLSITVEL